MWHLQGQTVFALPSTAEYSIRATGLPTATPGSTMTIGYGVPINTSVLEVSFINVPITANQIYTTRISTDPGNVDPIHLPGGGTRPPDAVELVEDVLFRVHLPLVSKGQ